MSLIILSYAWSLVCPCLSIHMNSSKYEGSWMAWQPLILFSLDLVLHQYDSMFCVWVPVMGSTKLISWFTLECEDTFGNVPTRLYAAHWSEWMIVPGATWAGWLEEVFEHFLHSLSPCNPKLVVVMCQLNQIPKSHY